MYDPYGNCAFGPILLKKSLMENFIFCGVRQKSMSLYITALNTVKYI